MCRTRTSHQIKLIDFGLAQTLKPDTPIRVLFGTPEFIPPEIINYEPIGTESDMWSVGVICYVLWVTIKIVILTRRFKDLSSNEHDRKTWSD